MNIVRENLMTQPGYSPYCGADRCRLRWPRTRFNGEQFECGCGWVSNFDAAFIADYKATMPVWKHCEGCTDLTGCEANGCLKTYKVEVEDCEEQPSVGCDK